MQADEAFLATDWQPLCGEMQLNVFSPAPSILKIVVLVPTCMPLCIHIFGNCWQPLKRCHSLKNGLNVAKQS